MNFNFENKPITFKHTSLFENQSLRQKLLEKKRKVDEYRPNESEFTDLYSEEEIRRDLAEIKRLEEIWKSQPSTEKEKYIKEVSEFYETVISDQIDRNEWFGSDCETFVASRYDDVKNGIDVVTIFNQESDKKYLGLGVDVTFASEAKVLEKKFQSIKERIKSGSLPALKYFKDPETGEHKSLMLPKVDHRISIIFC